MEIMDYISYGIGIAGISIIVWGVIVTFARMVSVEVKMLKGRKVFRESEAPRHQFGSYLLFGLEFLIAADIIYTITYPTISYFLDGDVAESYARKENEKTKTKTK